MAFRVFLMINDMSVPVFGKKNEIPQLCCKLFSILVPGEITTNFCS